MAIGVSTVRTLGVQDLVLPVGNKPIAKLSVSPGNYIITATCGVQLRAGQAGDVLYTVGLSLGNYFELSRGLLKPSEDMHIAAVTLGAKVARRSDILLQVTTNNPNAAVNAMNPSITAVQVDDLYFNKMPWTVRDFLERLIDRLFRRP